MAVMRYLRIGNDRYEIADEKLKVSEITSGITYYPILGSGMVNATSSRQWDSTGLQYDSFEGEEEGEGGNASLSLGNYIPVGETGSKRGNLILYGEEGSYSVLQSSTTGEGTGYYILLPDKQGTVALTDDIPTKVSQLENDLEFITEYTETDPTVPAWAKARTKPTYTAQEVGAIGSVTVSRALVEGTKSATITVDGTSYDIYSKSGTITNIKTTAGAHTTIDVSSGAVSFNIPTTAAHVGIKFGYTTSGNNRAVLQDSSGNLYVTQKDDNTNTTYTLSGALSSHKFTSTLTAGGSGSGTSTSELTFAAGTGITLTDDTTNKKITIAASHNGTVTSVAASGSGGITISGSPITSSGTITIGLNLSTAINGLSEGASPATINDYAVVQYAGGGTTTTTYHRRKLSNLIVGKAVADENGYNINDSYISLGKNTIALANGTDLNTITSPGNYRASNATIAKSLTNCPISTWFIMRVGYADGVSDSWEYQEIIQGNNGARYYRQHGGGTWTSWQSYISTSNYLPLTGGSVTGPTTFGDTVLIDDLNAGQLVVNGSASVTNNLQVNTINGHVLSTAKDNNSIAVRTANGYLYASYLNQSSAAETPTTSSYIMYANSDGFLRKSTLANIKTILGLGSNAYTSTAYLPLAGGTLTGNLTVGTTSQSAAPTGSIHVHDLRNYTIPVTMHPHGVNWFFHISDMPSNIWWSGMHINGWEGDYSAWELVGPSNNSDQRTTPLYVRSGRTTNDWGDWRKIYDSSNKPTASEVGALPLSGGTMTGDLLFSDSGTNTRQIRGITGANDYWRVAGGATASNAGWMEIATADDGNEPIYVRQYTGAYTTITRTLTLLDASGNTTLPGILTLYREGTTANNYPAAINFSVKDTTTGITDNNAYIHVYEDHATSAYGTNMVLQSGGGMFIGGGESPGAHYSAKGASYTGEDIFITTDGIIYLQANGNTIANRLGMAINTAHELVPIKADTYTNNVGSIGTASYKWANLYVTNINGATYHRTFVSTAAPTSSDGANGDIWFTYTA